LKLQRIDKVLRRLMLDQIEEAACIAEDCARLVADAACRIDVATLAVRLIQLRLCCIAMTRSYDDVVKLMEKSDGQRVAAAEAGPSDAHRADQRSGDVVA
jgi:hypothetical protein